MTLLTIAHATTTSREILKNANPIVDQIKGLIMLNLVLDDSTNNFSK